MNLKSENKNKTKKLVLLGMLAAVAVVLSSLENLLPPLPFLPPGSKAGFSNIITMYAAGAFGLPGAIGISLIKALFALMTRGAAAFLTSLCGGLLSTLIMALLLMKKSPFGFIGVGVAGSAAHQTGQFLVCSLLIGEAAFVYLPFMLLAGAVTGCVTGALLYLILPALTRLTVYND